MTENQQRFLKAIAERVTAARIAEVRLFPTIRQGSVESAVAVVALDSPDEAADREVPLVVASDVADGPEARAVDEVDLGEARYSILTARYTLTLKGPDRGKWDFEVVHDADAPLNAMERVSRGMAHRVGEDGEPDLLSAAEFHRAVTEPWWSK
jgi:hypothetical protein